MWIGKILKNRWRKRDFTKREEIFEEQESAEEKEEPTSVEDKEKDQHSECRRIVDESPPKSKSVPFTNTLKSKQKKKVEFNTNLVKIFQDVYIKVPLL